MWVVVVCVWIDFVSCLRCVVGLCCFCYEDLICFCLD